ncbi:MAG: NERD domain-containing protein [Tomitella sp.]|nr:NERD domain-containing protein [Tomitella sp.]
MLGLTHAPARAGKPRGDGPQLAAWEMRHVERAHRWHARNRVVVYVVAGVLAAVFVAAVVAGIAADDAAGAMGGVLTAALGGMLLRYTVLSRGAAVAVLSLLASIAMSVELSVRFGAGWFAVVPIAVSVVATVWVTMARVTALPRSAAAAIGQWIPVAVLLAVPVVGSVLTVVVGAVLTAAAMFFVANGDSWIAARKTASAMGWALRMPGLVVGAPTVRGTSTDIASGRWRHIIEAQDDTAGELDRLDDGWVVFHSRLVPGTGTLVDHVLVGPPGVVLVDTRYERGDLARDSVPVDGSATFDALLDDSGQWQAAGADGATGPEVLAQDIVPAAVEVEKIVGSDQAVPVTAVVAAQGARMVEAGSAGSVDYDDALRTVHIAAGPHVATYLEALPTVFDDAQVAAAARIVDYVMPRGY